MRREDRAKQFLPFDAMKGLYEALKEREEKVKKVERKELDEEETDALNAVLSVLKKGDRAEIVFFRSGKYFSLVGTIDGVERVGQYLTVGQEKIPFFDLYRVNIL